MLRILMAENAPSLNKGEMTIVGGILYCLYSEFGSVQMAMFSDNPEIDKRRYDNIDIVDVDAAFGIASGFRKKSFINNLFASMYCLAQHMIFIILYKINNNFSFKIMKSEIWKRYIESDVILVGHDNAFLGSGFETPLFLYPIYLPMFAQLLRKKIVFFGGGFSISEPNKEKSLSFLKYIIMISLKFSLINMDMVTLRERISFAYLKKIGFNDDQIRVTSDPAFLLQPENEKNVTEIMKIENIYGINRPLIGLTITRKRARMAYPNLSKSESYDRHIRIIADTVDNLISALNASIIFIPHCIGFGDESDDRIVADDICKLCKNKEFIINIKNEYSPSELKGLIGHLDFFFGERVHSVVNAMAMNVPSIILSDGKDVRLDIFKMAKQESAICIIDELDSDELFRKIYEIWINRDRLRENLNRNIETVKTQSMLNAKMLKDLLEI